MSTKNKRILVRPAQTTKQKPTKEGGTEAKGLCEKCSKAHGIAYKEILVRDELDPKKYLSQHVLLCATCAAPGRQTKREWVTCKGCNSATLKSFINPTRGLCKVCESRALQDEIDQADMVEF